ncbi:hypothetical protein EV183_002803 [Coemansia sp. RSA 2336]|nr:hypothetical protein EV183_002803 [Coemansia sp. RSA 2336]
MIVTPEVGVAAASCFEYNGDEVDNSPYSVMLGNGGIDSQNVTVTNIIPHPDYDSDTFANNLAIVKFSKANINSGAGFQVGDWPSEWPSFYFIHRTLQADQATWNEPNVIQDELASSDACGTASPLFKANNFDFICNSAVRQSFTDENCVLPYKFVVGYNSDKQAQLGFYSHSAIDGEGDFCNGGSNTIYNYYILLSNYIPWINSNIDSVVPTYHADAENHKPSTTSFKMDTSFEYTGNEPKLYSLYQLNVALKGNPEGASAEKNDPPDNEDKNSQSNDNDPADDGDKDVETTTVYKTKYKTEYETSTTTEYEGTTTTTVEGNVSTTTTTSTTTEHDETTIWTTEIETTTEISTTTSTVYNDAFTIVYSTKTETTTEFDVSTEISVTTETITETLADDVVDSSISYCNASYIESGEVVTATVTITETVSDTDEESVSSFVAVTVTVAQTTIYDTIAATTIVETETVTEEVSDTLSGLDSETDLETPTDDNTEENSDGEGSEDDGIISLTPPGNDDETDESTSDNESSDSNDTQQQTDQHSSGGLSIAAIIEILAYEAHMNRYILLALVVHFAAVLANTYAAASSKNTTHLFVRQGAPAANSALYNMHAKGLLINNNQQTFCQATIISSTAAVLAASCFDSTEKADPTVYKVYVEATDPNVVTQAQVSSITTHPSYNPQTFANNIAVVTFSAITTGMEYVIDNKPGLWDAFLHISNSLNSANTQWNTPEMSDLALGDQNGFNAVPNAPLESDVSLEPAISAGPALTTVSVTETEIETETITDTLDPVTETVTATLTLTNTEQLTGTLSTTQQQTDTVDHTATVSETVTATETTTEMVTTTLIQSITGTLTNTQTDMLTQSQTLTTSLITTVVSNSECPVMTCDPSIEVSEVTVTETQIESSVETETVTVTELGEITNEETEISTVYITVMETQSADTVTETTTVIQSESAEPEVIVSMVTETETDTTTEMMIETTTESIMDSPEEPSEEPSEEPEESEEPSSTAEDKPNSLQPWMIALIIIIILAILLIMLFLGCLYYRWRKRKHEQYLAGMVRPASYPSEYLNPALKEKDHDPYYIPSRYAQSERQSRYNSNGSYVGYI